LLTHTVNVTLVVNGDFSITVTPTSLTIGRGASGAYTVTIAAGPGFSGTVNLSVNGLPKFASSKLNPVSVVNSGTSVLTVNTNRNVAIATSTLTVTGTSGSGVHWANVSLIVQ
jgi:aminopeptidase S